MIDLLGTPFATVEFDFLEQHANIEEWNNTLYEIFKWVHELESHNEKCNIAFLNGFHIFYKEPYKKRINIYENKSNIKPKVNKQLIIVLDADSHSSFKEEIVKILASQNVKYKIVNQKIEQISGVPVTFVIEISI
ncbi:MAG: hypothetical protein FWE07_04610 [Turicibacter sp.]|nr:hypothetical protein [Turicibacter sp.]